MALVALLFLPLSVVGIQRARLLIQTHRRNPSIPNKLDPWIEDMLADLTFQLKRDNSFRGGLWYRGTGVTLSRNFHFELPVRAKACPLHCRVNRKPRCSLFRYLVSNPRLWKNSAGLRWTQGLGVCYMKSGQCMPAGFTPQPGGDVDRKIRARARWPHDAARGWNTRFILGAPL